MLKKNIILLCCLSLLLPLWGQELDCEVKVITQKITGVDNAVFKTLERNLSEILNTTYWGDKKGIKKIPCTFLLTLEGVSDENTYVANVQIQAARPVFNSSYLTPLINHKDQQVEFSFLPNESLQFERIGTNKEIVAIAAYYAYLILGLDADSFSKLGGTEYLKKALSICIQQGQEQANGGWSASERKINRYWIVEDLLNYRDLRETIYSYHREGLDKMVAAPRQAMNDMLQSIKDLKKVYHKSSDVAAMHMFFDAKANEITQSAMALTPKDRKAMYDLLGVIDPGHLGIYKALE